MLDVLNIQTYSFIYHKLLYIIRVSNSTKMCGICFVLGGAPITNHDFTNFNFFQSYLCKNKIALNEHIIENKLLLPLSVEPLKIK